MNSPEEIKKLAWSRLDEARILSQNNKCDGAFYLAGYSVELMLKAKICERLGIPNLFDDTDVQSNNIAGIGDVRKVLKTHNLFTLIIFSGLKVKFDEDKARNKILAKTNSLLFNSWNESVRYRPCGHVKDRDIQLLIQYLSDKEGVLTWIEQN